MKPSIKNNYNFSEITKAYVFVAKVKVIF